MRFRPCIDLHQGKVKQIVGSSLNLDAATLQTNFQAQEPAAWFARRYREDNLTGGHMILLGPGNETAAQEALAAWPGGLQLGGGVNLDNAKTWLDAGAEKLIVTSFVFRQGKLDEDRLQAISSLVGPHRLVLDLSCRPWAGSYFVVTDLWQNFTELAVTPATLSHLSRYAEEFLIHAVEVEGKALGVDAALIRILGSWGQAPMTYAGGISSWADIETLKTQGQGVLDFTVGSALDLFGGQGLAYADLVQAQGRQF